jgi:hypothetical protein
MLNEELLHLILLPLDQLVLSVLAKIVLVLLLLGWHRDASISFLLKKLSSFFHLGLLDSFVPLLQFSVLSIEIFLTGGELNFAFRNRCFDNLGGNFFVGEAILLLTDLFGLDAFCDRYYMSI